MDIAAAAAIGIASGVIVGTLVLQRRMPSRTRDLVTGLGGAGLALGGLLLLDDVSAVSWLITPLVVAALAVTHVRLLFAGEGPLRT